MLVRQRERKGCQQAPSFLKHRYAVSAYTVFVIKDILALYAQLHHFPLIGSSEIDKETRRELSDAATDALSVHIDVIRKLEIALRGVRKITY